MAITYVTVLYNWVGIRIGLLDCLYLGSISFGPLVLEITALAAELVGVSLS